MCVLANSGSLARTEYTTDVLRIENRVIPLTKANFHDYPRIEARLCELQSQITNSLDVTEEVDIRVISEKAKVFSEAVLTLANSEVPATENEWVAEIGQVWRFFGMGEHFSVG